MRLCVSVYSVLPPSMTTSPLDSNGCKSSSTASTAAPAGTIIRMRRGCFRLATSTAIESFAPARRPWVRALKLRRFPASRSKPLTAKPLRSRFRARFSPITPRPTRPISASCMVKILVCCLPGADTDAHMSADFATGPRGLMSHTRSWCLSFRLLASQSARKIKGLSPKRLL